MSYKPPFSLQAWLALLTLLVLVLSAAVWRLHRDLQVSNDLTTSSIARLGTELAANRVTASYSRAIAAPAEKSVYLTSLRLKLPLTELSTQLLYMVRDQGETGESQVTDVTTAQFAAYVPATPQRLACEPIRLGFGDRAHPYNPQEKPQPAVKLADGRTMQIYTFTDSSCIAPWRATGVNQQALAELFAHAKSF